MFAGRVAIMCDGPPTQLGNIQGGKVRALAITTAERSPVLPTVPPVADTLPGYAIPFWTAIFAPANTPADIVERIAAETRKAMQSPEVIRRYGDVGIVGVGSSPQELDRFWRERARSLCASASAGSSSLTSARSSRAPTSSRWSSARLAHPGARSRQPGSRSRIFGDGDRLGGPPGTARAMRPNGLLLCTKISAFRHARVRRRRLLSAGGFAGFRGTNLDRAVRTCATITGCLCLSASSLPF